MEKKRDQNHLFLLKTFLAWFSNIISTMCVHPIDTMKIRMQIQGELQ